MDDGRASLFGAGWDKLDKLDKLDMLDPTYLGHKPWNNLLTAPTTVLANHSLGTPANRPALATRANQPRRSTFAFACLMERPFAIPAQRSCSAALLILISWSVLIAGVHCLVVTAVTAVDNDVSCPVCGPHQVGLLSSMPGRL